MYNIIWTYMVLCLFIFTTANTSWATDGKKCDASLTNGEKTEEVASEKEKKEETKATPITPIGKVKITLADLAKTDKTNPIATYPALVMNAAQKYHQLITLGKPRRVKDPVFRVRNVELYPTFTGELGLAGTGSIIGQYPAVEALASHVASLARGEKGGKIFGVIGPGGTGKTEMFNVLDGVRGVLGKTNPDFYEFTFEWKNLQEVPALRGLTPRMGGEYAFSTIKPDMSRSPFTLLRPDIQEKVLDNLTDAVSEKMGFPLIAWTQVAPKEREIIEHIMAHEYKKVASREIGIEDLTEAEYLKALEKYVTVVPRQRNVFGTSDIIRAMGSNPDFGRLFVSQNPARMMLYANTSSLAWDFTGKVVAQDGGALVFDEAFRNEKEVLDSLLEVAQNQVAEADGPAVKLDVISMFATNDESVASAREDGDLKALIDRAHSVPMRLNLHPHEIAKTGLLMLGEKNFQMRPLPGVAENGKMQPLSLNEVYPLPDANGNLLGINRRYALYYTRGSGSSPILISPHTLEMMSMTAAATRLVVDAGKINGFPTEFERITPQHQYLTGVIPRLRMILGLDAVNDAIRAELSKWSLLTHEGESGISSRDIQSWLKKGLDIANKRGFGVLTPEIMDQAFKELLDEGTIEVTSNNVRAEWLRRYRMIKTNFTLPALHKDIQQIVAGHGDRANRLYDTVIREITALAVESSAADFQPDDGGQSRPINLERYNKIKEIFRKLHGRNFAPELLLQHFATAKNGSRHPELLAAVEAYITETELDIADTAREIVAYYGGKQVSPEVQKEVATIESKLSDYGYDANSFNAALTYWNVLHGETRKK